MKLWISWVSHETIYNVVLTKTKYIKRFTWN